MRKQLASDPGGKAGVENQPESRPCRGQSLGARHIPTESQVLEGINPAKGRVLESGASLRVIPREVEGCHFSMQLESLLCRSFLQRKCWVNQ